MANMPNFTFCINLYIPHGSDNTKSRFSNPIKGCDLYIPHGSDNTNYLQNRQKWICIFISHMVQIIPVITKALSPTS